MRTRTRIASALGASALIIGALSVSPAQATEQGSTGTQAYCNTWIDGAWGKASCYNNFGYDRTAWILVTCVDFWDPNVRDTAVVQNGSTATLTGNCWGAVQKVEAGWE